MSSGMIIGLEMALVASGFLLPALHLVASKRASELAAQPVGVPPQRVALRAFTPGGLSSLRWVTAAGMVFCYAGWAAVRPTVPDEVAAVPSLVAMVVVLLRWVIRTDGGRTQAPEGALLHDPVVSVAALGARLRRIGVERALRGRPQIAYAPGPLRGVGPALLVPRALWRRLEL